MRHLAPAIALVTSYIGLVFLLAVWVEHRAARGRNVAEKPLIYALAQAVFCTTWTYYGSVGFTVRTGVLFLTVYLGPTLAYIFSGSILRKLVRIKTSHRITSIADFISARYGKSQALGTLATVMATVGMVPYVSLQIKTMIRTLTIVTGRETNYPEVGRVIGPVVVLLMIALTVVFGLRRLRPTERHPGMMAALVAECAVKLLAFLAAGIFVTYVLYSGFGDLLHRAATLPTAPELAGRGVTPPLGTWVAYLLVSAAAILFLPRQFHLAVVENSNEDHIRTAQWLLPLYLLAICVFVLPIAIAGVDRGLPASNGDLFVLMLPAAAGPRWLSWAVYLGGFSAGAGMLMIETVTLATMLSNHVLLPVVDRVPRLGFMRGRIRPFRWTVAAVIITAAFGYERLIGWRQELVLTGIVSFAIVFQFVPAIIGGLFWKGASRIGALLGLSGGFFVWTYTLVVPLLSRQGFLPLSLVERGPFGLTWLRPESLLDLGRFDPVTHSVLWSFALNAGLFLTGSQLWPPSADEAEEGARMVDVLSPETPAFNGARGPALIDAADKRRLVEARLAAYFGPGEAGWLAGEVFHEAGVNPEGKMSVLDLAEIEGQVELALASAIGAAAAHVALKRESIVTPEEATELAAAYAEMLAEMKVAPAELRRKVDYHQERARLLASEADTLRTLADASRRLSMSLEYEATARTVVRLPVPTLAPAALLYLFEQLPGQPPRHFLLAHVDPEQELASNRALAASHLEPGGLPHLARVIAARRPDLAAPDVPLQWPPPLSTLQFRLSLTVPLLVPRATLGTLTLFANDSNPFDHPRDVALAQELAFRCATALENAYLYARTQEAVRARDEFLAIASHELKTPLTPLALQVGALSDLVNRGELVNLPQSKLATLLKRSDEQIFRLAELVDRLLDVSRVTPGQLRLVLEETDLAQVARRVTKFLSEQLSAAGCPLVLDLAAEVVGRWDRLRLEQALTNLLTNAAKYAPGKPVVVQVRAAPGRATLVVRDQGPGIRPDEQERLFRPFERAISFVHVSGFGLGLYIVRQIAEAHGGRVYLESQPGHGCTFTIELPLAPGQPEPEPARA
jgi:signal transduction histidine kinase/Na+/proline symporter